MLDNTQSIICAFGLAAAAPRSPYRHLELCGIALIITRPNKIANILPNVLQYSRNHKGVVLWQSKMICSDIDGTLLQYGRKKLEGEIFDQIRALHDRGILFCPASGRQTPACACCLRRWPTAVFSCARTAACCSRTSTASPKTQCPAHWRRKSPTTCGTAARARARSCSRARTAPI